MEGRHIGRDAALSLVREGIERAEIRVWWIRASGWVPVETADLPRLLLDPKENNGWFMMPANSPISGDWAKEPIELSLRDTEAFLNARLPVTRRKEGRPPTHDWARGFAELLAVFLTDGIPAKPEGWPRALKQVLGEIECYPDDREVRRLAHVARAGYERRMKGS
jgi:hypothetical protein